jgi:hypothetical protein
MCEGGEEGETHERQDWNALPQFASHVRMRSTSDGFGGSGYGIATSSLDASLARAHDTRASARTP